MISAGRKLIAIPRFPKTRVLKFHQRSNPFRFAVEIPVPRFKKWHTGNPVEWAFVKNQTHLHHLLVLPPSF
jgi:hypothetical protein